MHRLVYESIEAIGRGPVSGLDGSRLDFSYGLLRAVEKSLFGDLVVRYLTIEDERGVLAMMPVYVGTNVNINALMPKSIQDGYFKLVALLGDAAKTRFLIAGSLISDKGWIPMLPEAQSPELVGEMMAHIDDFCIGQRVKIGMIKDIHRDFPREMTDRIVERGFQKLYSLPTVTIGTDYPNFDAYVQNLKKNARKHARKVLKAASQRFVFETVNDIASYIDLIYPLFRATYLKAKYQFDESTPAFLHYAAQIDDLGKELILCRKDGRVVGALINFFDDKEQLNKRIGIDYGEEDTPLIYTSLMYQGMRSAIERGLKRVYLGQSTYVPKVRLGGDLEDEYFCVKPYDPLLRLSMPWQIRRSENYRAELVEALALEGTSV